MAQTFNDFVAECVSYPYSKENYELMKEAAEIDIMSQYLENQAFYAENIAEATIGVAYTESYFMESASEDQVQAITEAFGDKAKGFFRKVWEGMKKVVDKVIRFFGMIAVKFAKSTKECADLYKRLRAAKLSAAQVKELGDILVNAAKAANLNLIKAQPFKVNLAVTGFDVNYLKYYQAALSTSTVRLGRGGSNNDCIDADTLIKVLNKFASDNKKQDFESTVKLIESARIEGARTGVEVVADDKKIEALVKSLEGVKEKLDKMNVDELDQGAFTDATKMREAWAMINTTVGETIKQYGGFVKYRQESHTAINDFLNKINPSSATNNAEADDFVED